MTKLPDVVILDGDGRSVFDGSLLSFARENGPDVLAECIAQWRASLSVNGRLEPAFIGGGASPHFHVCLEPQGVV